MLNGKEKNLALLKVGIGAFILAVKKSKIIGMISHLGPQLGVADGIALASKLKHNNEVTAVFSGEGATSEGDFHEALNIASVWDLPVLFCIENNGYGLSTPTSEQYRCKAIVDKGLGYGMEAHQIDGNNIVEVYQKISEIAASVRKNPRPVLIEFITFRRRGHEEASGTKYVPKELISAWEEKDPITNFENYLFSKNILNDGMLKSFKKEIETDIQECLDFAFKEEPIAYEEKSFIEDVYSPFNFKAVKSGVNTSYIRFIDAVQEGLKEGMSSMKNTIIMGQDIALYGGAFKVTEGFVDLFGSERVRNTPICESGIVETAMGLSIGGFKAIVEMQFADFVSSGFNPIVNYLAKNHFRW